MISWKLIIKHYLNRVSNFFDKSDLTRKDADAIVSDTLQNCDDGELYLEDTKSESILLDDNKIKSSSYSSDLGFGFRAITGEVVAYSHSNEISKDSLKKSSENLKSTLKSMKGTYNQDPFAVPVLISVSCLLVLILLIIFLRWIAVSQRDLYSQ